MVAMLPEGLSATAAGDFRPRSLGNESPFSSLSRAKQLARSVAMLPEGLEPPTTGSKPVMISISPRER